ncbi:ATP-binding protein [Neobacillus sedimentimangrovi]|uniref:histidine kinase n=1 Tax=Neobacillus sedimentimangrovi TaxID=2699460 RepID=A0ABS8QLI6_9BACI|nr:ATP-binding protein [Neobacillus sedimentimangrovi]MCD4840141.1 ATP-binding protein [Neobacillus sedimentimangrovi]
MKRFKGNFYLYLTIVIIPLLFLGLYFGLDILKENDFKRENQAKWIASIYKEQWDQFISETVTSLEILSITARENLDSPKKMEPLLVQVNQNDPRYGGLYLLDSKGNLMAGTVPLRTEENFSEIPFIKEVIKAKDIIISDHKEVLRNNQLVIGLATPVLDEKNELKGILVADLRIDYMKNVMKVLTPDTKLYVVNGGDKPILEMNVDRNEIYKQKDWVTLPMNQLPWNIKVKIADRDLSELGLAISQIIFIILIITHVLYLLIEYIMLRIKTKKERKENEIHKLELVGSLAASTAHEIRNPLTGVKGFIQLLSEKYTKEEDQYYFNVINSELNRINQIVGEFLILGKPTAQLMNNVNIIETLNELKPLIVSEANAHNIECKWLLPDQPVMVKCAKDQMKQVILNLTKNAFESIESCGTIQVKLQLLEQECKLEIIDNGKGIPEEDIEKIFQPFYTSKATGTGLGLVICKRIIDSFDGKIQIYSTVSVGTTVEITLPIVKNK